MIAGMRLPKPRGPLSAALCTDLAAGRPLAPGTAAAAETLLAATADPLHDDDLQLSLAICYELHYRGFDDVADGWEWEPELLRLRAVLEQRHLAALRALVGDARGHRRPGRPAADRADRRRRRPVAVPPPGPERHARAVARVPHAAVGLPPQGGRPAHLGDPPAGRPGQGGDGGDPGRRVRRRLRRAHAQPAVRRDDARPRPGHRLRRAVGRRPGGRLHLGQHDVAVRPAPGAARRLPRPPGRGGDDLLRAQPPLLLGAAPARLRRCDHRLLRRARRGRRRPRADRLGRHVRRPWWPRTPRCRPTSCSGPPARWPSTGSTAVHLLGAWEAGRSGLHRQPALAA